jgi:hypothetical protein
MSEPSLNSPAGPQLSPKEIQSLAEMLRNNPGIVQRALHCATARDSIIDSSAALSPELIAAEGASASARETPYELGPDDTLRRLAVEYLSARINTENNPSRTGGFPAVRLLANDLLEQAAGSSALAAGDLMRLLRIFAQAIRDHIKHIAMQASAAGNGSGDSPSWTPLVCEPISFWFAAAYPQATLYRLARLKYAFPPTREGNEQQLRFMLHEFAGRTSAEIARFYQDLGNPLRQSDLDAELQRDREHIYGTTACTKPAAQPDAPAPSVHLPSMSSAGTFWLPVVELLAKTLVLRLATPAAAPLAFELLGIPAEQSWANKSPSLQRVAATFRPDSTGQGSLLTFTTRDFGTPQALILFDPPKAVRRSLITELPLAAVVRLASPLPDAAEIDSHFAIALSDHHPTDAPGQPTYSLKFDRANGILQITASANFTDRSTVVYTIIEIADHPPSPILLTRPNLIAPTFTGAFRLPRTPAPEGEQLVSLFIRDLSLDDLRYLPLAALNLWLATWPTVTLPLADVPDGFELVLTETDVQFIEAHPSAAFAVRVGLSATPPGIL